jgi:hypothetical protein
MKARAKATKKRLTKRKYIRNNSKKLGKKRYTRRAVAMKGG